MLETLLTIVYAVVAFGFLVMIHELGHFFGGRLCKIGVEELTIGFGRGPSFVRKGIKYKIGWIPFGGGCKFKGQADFGKAEIKGDPDEFYNRPVWARLVAVLFGPLANLILASILFTFLIWFNGDSVVKNGPIEIEHPGTVMVEEGISTQLTPIKSKITKLFGLDELAKNNPNDFLLSWTTDLNSKMNENGYTSPKEIKGLQTGDKIIKVGNQNISSFQDLAESWIDNLGDTVDVQVERFDNYSNQKKLVTLNFNIGSPQQFQKSISQKSSEYMIVHMVGENSPAEKAGFKVGDIILSINNKSILNIEELRSLLKDKNIKEEFYNVKVKRNNEIVVLNVNRQEVVNNNHLLGISPLNYGLDDIIKIEYSFPQSFIKSIEKIGMLIDTTMVGLGKLFTGKLDPREGLSGPIKIFKTVGEVGAKFGFIQFLGIVATISALLGFFNLLPIPAVDGGHILLFLIEIIRRKPFSQKVIYSIQVIGFILIVTLAIVVSINDIYNWNVGF